jgi:hypothetical protein
MCKATDSPRRMTVLDLPLPVGSDLNVVRDYLNSVRFLVSNVFRQDGTNQRCHPTAYPGSAVHSNARRKSDTPRHNDDRNVVSLTPVIKLPKTLIQRYSWSPPISPEHKLSQGTLVHTFLQEFLALIKRVPIRNHAVQHLAESVPVVPFSGKVPVHTSGTDLKVASPAKTFRFPSLRFSFPYPILSVMSVHHNQRRRTAREAREFPTVIRVTAGNGSIPASRTSRGHVEMENRRKRLDQTPD